jgi:hypothetical protein
VRECLFNPKNNAQTPDYPVQQIREEAVVCRNSTLLKQKCRRLPQTATFDRMPGVLAVIADPDARFFQELHIGMPAQGTYNSGSFPFLVV